jgi:tetratricopeptide (TPR) repeat protein
MKTTSVIYRGKTSNKWGNIKGIYYRLLNSLYKHEDYKSANKFAEELKILLHRVDPNHETIFGEECWSLISESQGNLAEAIKYREHEIQLIRQLHEETKNNPASAGVLKYYGYDDFCDRMDLLAILYHDIGELDKAIAVLQESKRVCQQHGIKFDGEDLMEKYLQEKPRTTSSYAVYLRAESKVLSEPHRYRLNEDDFNPGIQRSVDYGPIPQFFPRKASGRSPVPR